MASSVCNQCKQRIVGKGFEIKGKTYCGGCYSDLLEELERKEKDKKQLGDFLLQLFQVSDLPIETISQIDFFVNEQKNIDDIKNILSYYYNILENEIKYSDLYYINKIVDKYCNSYKHYLLEKEKIKKQNELIDLKNIPSQTIIIRKEKKRGGKKPSYNMEDL